jgi:hypothetical protein
LYQAVAPSSRNRRGGSLSLDFFTLLLIESLAVGKKEEGQKVIRVFEEVDMAALRPTPEDINQARSELDQVRNVHIDGSGLTFKYILVRVTRKVHNVPKNQIVTKYIVRGFIECAYHGEYWVHITHQSSVHSALLY